MRIQQHLQMNRFRGAGQFLCGSRSPTRLDCQLIPRLYVAMTGLKKFQPSWRIPSEMAELRAYIKTSFGHPLWQTVVPASGTVEAMLSPVMELFRWDRSESVVRRRVLGSEYENEDTSG